MSPSVTQSTPGSAAGAGASSGTTAATAAPPVTEDMFLQLLVAQLQNQDPSSPSDSTQFVTQLAQFQTMEQSMNQGQDISSILADMNQIVAALPAASTSTNTGGSAPTPSN